MKPTAIITAQAFKGLFTVLVSALLLWTQTAGSTVCAGESAPPACKKCSCGQPDCCLAKSPKDSSRAPVAPAPAPILLKSQWIATLMTALLQPPIEAHLLPAGPLVFSSQFNAVPLHLRHCVFLI